MAHHHAHSRTITLTVPSVPWRRLIRALGTGARNLERTAERHWPFAAYGVLTIATAGYVIAQLARI